MSPIDEAGICVFAKELHDANIETLIVALINSFANGEHVTVQLVGR